MAEDKFNNQDGTPGPDNIPDDQADPMAKAKYNKFVQEQAATDRAAALAYQNGGVPGAGGLSDLTLSPEQAAATVAALDAANAKDKGFEVQLNGLNPDIPIRRRLPGQMVELDAGLKDGFFGLQDENMVQKVVGLADNNPNYYDVVYKAALQQAAYMQKAGDDVTVDQLLDRWSKGGLPEALKKLVSGGGGSGGAFSSVNRVVSLTEPGTARQLINRALSGYLGRQATDMESKAFLKALNVQEKANPTITTTKGYSNGSGSSTSSQTVTGGFNKDDFAERFAKSQQGYAEYQAATTYLDAFIGALESDSRVI